MGVKDGDHRITVIYVMGYGRSGSTILDVLLNHHTKIVSVGALINIYQWLLRNEECACSRPIRKCNFWRAVADQHFRNAFEEASRMERLQTRIESRRDYPALVLGLKSKAKLRRYGEEV